ncbi:MAG: hypothetical protein ACFHVJ_03035 [Aestuariibacter sp.]
MSLNQPVNSGTSSEKYAVIDLGSNSFHMFIARLEGGRPVILQRVKDKVRLARGLNRDNLLSQEAIQRGLDCLKEFARHLQQIPLQNRQVVATATLRLATNSPDFVAQGEAILGTPIQVISGEQEADYIYRGATQHLNTQRHLILDIGGASTEVIVGNGAQAQHRVSFNMGCVTFMQRYFKDNHNLQDNIHNAVSAATRQLIPELQRFTEHGWDDCYGASGTPQALHEIKRHHQDTSSINLAFLQQQASLLKVATDTGSYLLPGLGEARQAVFPAGLAILTALFQVFNIQQMGLADGALREGLLFELAGHCSHQ